MVFQIVFARLAGKTRFEQWRQKMERLPNGETRSYFDQLSIVEAERALTLSLRVFTSQPYNAPERTQFAQLVAARLGRPMDSVRLELIEVPTSAAALARAREERLVEAPPAVAQLAANFQREVRTALVLPRSA